MYKYQKSFNNINMKTNELEFTILTDEEFSTFAKKHQQRNFFQSLNMKELLLRENREVYLVGVKKNQEILGATLLTINNNFMGKKTFEALKGYLIDYNNYDLLNFFTNSIINFINSHNGYRLIIDPYIIKVQRDSEANIVKNGLNNSLAINNLTKIGFTPLNNSVQVKWTYVLDINNKTAEELLKSFKPNTRNYINRTINKYQLIVEELKYNDIDIFKEITNNTCQRRGFKDRSIKYYQNMYKIFKDDLKILICKLDCDLYLKTLTQQLEGLQQKITNLDDSINNSKKKATILKNRNIIKKKIKEVETLRKEKGKYIILSGAMFVLYGDEIVYLFSGSYEEYMKYCGQYRLQWEMIKYAADHHYRRYNFYGIKDVFDKNGKDYGVYEFKKGFNGYVEELVGAFEIGTNKYYQIYNILKKIKYILNVK